MRDIMSDLKESLGTGTSSMNNTLWDPLTIKISKFLYQMVIFKEDWAYKIVQLCIKATEVTIFMQLGSKQKSKAQATKLLVQFMLK